ncbi:unnamed protein product [Lactuca saligna]|uniref:Uncharacterized protein n=1 Tax=Lactuca saligna TaxID=75948 RepID=A0AA35Y9G0_LACSI|nr:unnamed protein product [Lactuca saligna]
MLASISASSNLLQQYQKRKSVGPRELTPTMLRSIEEADKPAKWGKKPESQKEGYVAKPSKGQTPKKRKTDKAAASQPQPKKQKKPARRLILQSSSDSDSEYVPPNQKKALSSDSENESSYEEASGRADTPPHSPTLEIPAVAAKNAATVTSSVETLQQTLQSECSKVEAARLAIEQKNEAFHATVNERLSQLQANLAMENGIMDELSRCTNQLKL